MNNIRGCKQNVHVPHPPKHIIAMNIFAMGCTENYIKPNLHKLEGAPSLLSKHCHFVSVQTSQHLVNFHSLSVMALWVLL